MATHTVFDGESIILHSVKSAAKHLQAGSVAVEDLAVQSLGTLAWICLRILEKQLLKAQTSKAKNDQNSPEKPNQAGVNE